MGIFNEKKKGKRDWKGLGIGIMGYKGVLL